MRAKHEVELGVQHHGEDDRAKCAASTHGLLHVVRTGLLKHLLRSMLRMMQSRHGFCLGLRALHACLRVPTMFSQNAQPYKRVIDCRSDWAVYDQPRGGGWTPFFCHGDVEHESCIEAGSFYLKESYDCRLALNYGDWANFLRSV